MGQCKAVFVYVKGVFVGVMSAQFVGVMCAQFD